MSHTLDWHDKQLSKFTAHIIVINIQISHLEPFVKQFSFASDKRLNLPLFYFQTHLKWQTNHNRNCYTSLKVFMAVISMTNYCRKKILKTQKWVLNHQVLNCMLNITQIIFAIASTMHIWQEIQVFYKGKGEHVKFDCFLAVIFFKNVSNWIDVIPNDGKKIRRCA